jgi:Abortive infection C-terminus
MLLETVCKHILDEAGISYPDDADLPKLWALSAELLKLAPHQHQEDIFKRILGNCQSVVNYLGSIRNKIGDAHGQGRKPVKPKARQGTHHMPADKPRSAKHRHEPVRAYQFVRHFFHQSQSDLMTNGIVKVGQP